MAAVGNYEIITGTVGPYLPSGSDRTELLLVSIPADKKILGGFVNKISSFGIFEGYPSNSIGNEWTFKTYVPGNKGTIEGTYFVICAEMGG